MSCSATQQLLLRNRSMRHRMIRLLIPSLLTLVWCTSMVSDAQASDWTVITQGIQTDDSSGMTAQLDWEITAKATLTPATTAFLPFQGIRIHLDTWSVQALDRTGPTEDGGTASFTCSAADGMLVALQNLASHLSVPPDVSSPLSLALTLMQGAIQEWIQELLLGIGQFAIEYNQAIGEMVNGCSAQFSESMDILAFGPGTYRVDAKATLSMVEMFDVSVSASGGVGIQKIINLALSGNLALGAEAHPDKTLRENARVKLKCPPGTEWDPSEAECKAPETPDLPGDPQDLGCPEGAIPGSPEYCACWANIGSQACLSCELSDGSHFPVLPGDPPIDDDSFPVCTSNYSFYSEGEAICAVVELFCLGGTFPRTKTLPPGTTGQPLMGCSNGLSWGPCPDQPEGLPVLIPDQSPSYGLPDCWQVGDVIVNPVPGVCENNAPGLLPDLVVSSIEVIGGPYNAGDTILWAVKVRNQGSNIAYTTGIRVQLQGPGGTHALEEQSGALGPGNERIFEISSSGFPYTAVAGPHLLNVLVDPNHLEVELTDENNTGFITFDVGSEPSPTSDLLVTPLELLPEQPAEGHALTAAFEIHNAGTVALPEATYIVRIDRGGEVEAEAFPLPATQPGDVLQRSITLAEVSEGPHSVSVFVDSEEVVMEDNENNNSTTRTFTVENAAGECLPCTSGQPNNAVGAQYCTDPADPTLPPWEGPLFTCMGVRANGTSCEPSGIHPNGWGYTGPRCPDPATLFQGAYHRDLCGNPGVCPGTRPLPF